MPPLSTLTLEAWARALAGPDPVPAGGALALVTLAGAAALGAKLAAIGGRDPAALSEVAGFFLEAAEEDAATYAATLAGGEAKLSCVDAGLHHLEAALEALERLQGLFDGLPPHLSADVAAAARLARASAQTLLVNLAVNASQWGDCLAGPVFDRMLQDLGELKSRLGAA